MTDPGDLPALVRHQLDALGAVPRTIARLGGMGGGRVYRVRHPGGALIVKRTTRPAEPHLYRTLAPALARRGIGLPALAWAGRDGAGWWLILEDIPAPLPGERRLADPAALAMLRRLHTGALAPADLPRDGYHPAWTARLDELALAALPPDARGPLAPLLAGLREDNQALFAPTCPIHGDPNPANWGLRFDGSLVLYDWERLTLGTPALDLAITVPGLGDDAAYRRVAAAYLGAGDPAPHPPGPAALDALARAIAAAKLWSVVEFLGGVATAAIRPDPALAALLQGVPAWVGRIAARA